MLKLIPKILAFLALICSGLTLGVVSIEAVLQLGSHMARYNHANRVALDDGRQRQVRILCIGESTTQGQGGVEDSYPYQLESILNQNNWNTKFQVVNLGISGMLSTEIADKLEQWIYDYKPVAVVSMVGINDSRHQFMLRSAWHDEHHSGPSLLNTSRAVKLFRILWNGVKPKLARIIGLEISSQSVSNFSTSNNRNQRQDLLTRIGEEMASSYSSERELERIVTLKKLYARVGNFRDAAEVTVRLQEILCNSNCPKDSLRGRPLLWKTLRQLNIEASHYFAAAGDYVAAENQLRAALARGDKSAEVLMELGQRLAQDNPKEALELLQKAVDSEPLNRLPYFTLAALLEAQGKAEQAQKVLERALQNVNEKTIVRIVLADFVGRHNQIDRAEALLALAIREDPGEASAIQRLAELKRRRGDFRSAERLYLDALPIQHAFFRDLGELYFSNEDFQKALESYERYSDARDIPDNFPSDSSRKDYAVSLMLAGKNAGEIRTFLEQTGNALISSNYYTQRNYLRILSTASQHNVLLFALPYPTLNDGYLRNILGHSDNLIFVNNSRNFYEQLKSVPFEDLFTDRFGGTFGHLTARGNRLIADNVASAIRSAIERGQLPIPAM